MIGYDGLDPVFTFIEELIVIGGDMVLFMRLEIWKRFIRSLLVGFKIS